MSALFVKEDQSQAGEWKTLITLDPGACGEKPITAGSALTFRYSASADAQSEDSIGPHRVTPRSFLHAASEGNHRKTGCVGRGRLPAWIHSI